MKTITTKRQVSTIGLDVDDHEFRAVQLIRRNSEISAHAWAIFPRLNLDDGASEAASFLPDPHELNWAISILQRRGFQGHEISCVPRTRDCTQHVIELPPADSGAPLDQLAKVEVARARKSDPNEFEIGHWPIPQRGRSNESMAVACSKQVIDSIIEHYESGDLETVGIDLPEIAIMRGALLTSEIKIPPTEAHIDAVLHIGWNSALAIVTLGQRIVYVRRITTGANGVWKSACEKYGLSHRGAQAVLDDHVSTEHSDEVERLRTACWTSTAKSLSAELDVALAYVSHSFRMSPLGKIILCGYGSQNETIRSHLDQVLGIPIVQSLPNVMQYIESGTPSPAQSAKLTLACGLAARFDT